MNGVLLPRNCFQFPLVKIIISKSAYKSFENTKNEHVLTTSHRKVAREFFQGLLMYSIVQKLDGIDQGYQSHQFLTQSNV